MKLLSINKQKISVIESSNFGNLSKSFIIAEYQYILKEKENLKANFVWKLMKQSDLSGCPQDEFQYQRNPSSNENLTDSPT